MREKYKSVSSRMSFWEYKKMCLSICYIRKKTKDKIARDVYRVSFRSDIKYSEETAGVTGNFNIYKLTLLLFRF